MDEIALREIENAIRRAKARMRQSAIVCKDCGHEMTIQHRRAVCWQCRHVELLRPQSQDTVVWYDVRSY